MLDVIGTSAGAAHRRRIDCVSSDFVRKLASFLDRRRLRHPSVSSHFLPRRSRWETKNPVTKRAWPHQGRKRKWIGDTHQTGGKHKTLLPLERCVISFGIPFVHVSSNSVIERRPRLPALLDTLSCSY